MMRPIVALGLVSALVATTCAQVVLGNGRGSIVGVNRLAASGSSGGPLEWSRNTFTDSVLGTYGFYPAFTIQVPGDLFDINGNLLGDGDDNSLVTVNTVDALRDGVNFNWPTSFQVPRYLVRQGGANTNVSRNGDHSVRGRVWIVYRLADNPNGWNVTQVRVFTWDVRDVIHKTGPNKTRVFSDTQSPFQIDVFVSSAQSDPDPTIDPQDAPNIWTFVGRLSKADGTILNVCEWDPSTGNTFGECPRPTLQFLSGQNPQNVAFFNDPTNEIWYSKLNISGQRNVRYVALVIPLGNQYGQDPTLRNSTNTSSSLQFCNITDVRVIASPEGDVNGDGCVNDQDLLQILLNFGNPGKGDINGDGTINDQDLLTALLNFGQGC